MSKPRALSLIRFIYDALETQLLWCTDILVTTGAGVLKILVVADLSLVWTISVRLASVEDRYLSSPYILRLYGHFERSLRAVGIVACCSWNSGRLRLIDRWNFVIMEVCGLCSLFLAFCCTFTPSEMRLWQFVTFYSCLPSLMTFRTWYSA